MRSDTNMIRTYDISRREFLEAGALTLGGLAFVQHGLNSIPSVRGAEKKLPELPPTRTITHGPRHHWFGYYDKLQFDPTSRYVLGMEVDFEHRSPLPEDELKIGMIDIEDNDRWIELGSSTAWCWQQGCMLQWLPGSKSTIVWNDRGESSYICRILDVRTKEMRTIPHPIYALHPDGRNAIATDFRRLGDTRPGYGYNGIADPFADDVAPKESGIFHVDLVTGEQKLLISIADVVAFGPQLPSMKEGKHWFNHLLFNQDGSRFVFLHRWSVGMGRLTRMVTARTDGSDLRVLDANGLTSHFIWRDPNHILSWSNQPTHGPRFYLFEDSDGGAIEVVGENEMTQDAHCSYLPGNEWILNDSYPDKDRLQHPYLYHVESKRIVPLGHFLSPPEYTKEWRCDTHPRFSPNGKYVVIDSPHQDEGRQLHLIDISKIVG
ncbi:MAG: hypothetical protein ACKVT0_15070 [Planctomycetaceae bacterium]